MTTLLSPDERTAMRQGVISQRTAWIREQAKYYTEAGVPIDIKVVWHNRPFEAIIQEVVAGGHDLLLKMAHQHDKLESVIFTPTDWHLLRKCPCPVWMVKDQPWPEGGKAVVAVNLASEEDYHNSLNEKLVKETLSLPTKVNHTEVHLVGAYPVTPINIAIELPEFDPSVYNDAIRGQHLLAMKALRQKFSIDENMTHVEKGYRKRLFRIWRSICRPGLWCWAPLAGPVFLPRSREYRRAGDRPSALRPSGHQTG